MTESEKNAIREQHSGGMKVMTEKFSKLLNTKSGDVKPLVKESAVGTSSMDRIQAIFDCAGLETAGAGWTAQVFEIESQMPLLSKLMSVTDDLNMSAFSNWDEKGILEFMNSLVGNRSEMDKIQKVLTCYMKKMNTPMVGTNPLLTLAKKAFKTRLGGFELPDLGGGKELKQAQDILSKMGIKL